MTDLDWPSRFSDPPPTCQYTVKFSLERLHPPQQSPEVSGTHLK